MEDKTLTLRVYRKTSVKLLFLLKLPADVVLLQAVYPL
jgi:hypothetical protein